MISKCSRAVAVAVAVVCLVVAAAVLSLPAAATPATGPALRIQRVPGLNRVPSGTPCKGLSYDVNETDLGVAVISGKGSAAIFLQRFVPPSYPFRPTAVCIAADSEVPAAYEVVLYSDSDGMPGVRIAQVTAAPAPPETTWMTTSVASSVSLLSGPFWAGTRTPRSDLYVACDDPGERGATAALSGDDGATFSIFWPRSNPSLYIRVVGLSGPDFNAIPTLSGLGLTALVAALAAGGFLLLRKA